MLCSHLGKASKLSKLELRTLGETGRATLVVQLCESDLKEEAIHFHLGRGPAAVCGTGHKRLI
jgi:hypothetical protein